MAHVAVVTTTAWGTAGTSWQTVQANYTYDAYNNATSVTEIDPQDSTWTNRRTDTGYEYFTSTWVLDRPSFVASGPAAGPPLTRREFAYDAGGKGNVTAIRECKSGTSCTAAATTGISYGAPDPIAGSTGLPTRVVDPLGNATEILYATNLYGWDNRRLYPTKITNALGQVSYARVDLRFGRPQHSVAPTGALTSLQYDGLGRLTAVFRNGEGTAWRMFDYAFGQPPAWRATRRCRVGWTPSSASPTTPPATARRARSSTASGGRSRASARTGSRARRR